MAEKKPEPGSTARSDRPAVEQTIEHIREMNERLIESSKTAGTVALDSYEKALQGMLDFQQKIAGASQLDWVTALAETHAQFVQDFSGAYIKAARDNLK
jgi:hypothetical protein